MVPVCLLAYSGSLRQSMLELLHLEFLNEDNILRKIG